MTTAELDRLKRSYEKLDHRIGRTILALFGNDLPAAIEAFYYKHRGAHLLTEKWEEKNLVPALAEAGDKAGVIEAEFAELREAAKIVRDGMAANKALKEAKREKVAQKEASVVTVSTTGVKVNKELRQTYDSLAGAMMEARAKFIKLQAEAAENRVRSAAKGFRGHYLWSIIQRYGIDRAVEVARNDAVRESQTSFDSYVGKLAGKIGKVVVSATLCGDPWTGSILTVTDSNGVTEKWATRIIINVSIHGKLFNQFPTRKLPASSNKDA